MEVVELTAKVNGKGQLKIDVPTNLEAGTVDCDRPYQLPTPYTINLFPSKFGGRGGQ